MNGSRDMVPSLSVAHRTWCSRIEWLIRNGALGLIGSRYVVLSSWLALGVMVPTLFMAAPRCLVLSHHMALGVWRSLPLLAFVSWFSQGIWL